MKGQGTILVIRAEGRFSSAVRKCGFEVVNLELIATEPFWDAETMDAVLNRLGAFDGLIFTSSAAAEIFADLLVSRSVGFAGRIYVLGQRSQEIFSSRGFSVAFRPEANSAAEMIKAFGIGEFAGKAILFVRGESSLRIIPEILREAALVEELSVYRTVKKLPGGTEALGARMANGDFAWVCFFSPSGVEAFSERFAASISQRLSTAVIGETTAKAATECGFDVKFVSPFANSEHFANAFCKFIRNH